MQERRLAWGDWFQQRWARAGVRRPPPAAQDSGKPAAANSRLLDILVGHRAFHAPELLASLLMTSRAMQQCIARVAHRQLVLRVAGLKASTMISFSAWLISHGALLAALDVAAEVACCQADTRAACIPLLKALSTVPPGVRLRLTLPDVLPGDVAQLPRGLLGLRLCASSAAASTLRAISRQCPELQDVRLVYLCDSVRASGALSRARGGWPSLPVLELAFVGTGQPALSPGAQAKQGVLSLASLEQLARLPRLECIVFAGCCINAMLDEVAATLRACMSLRALVVPAPDKGGVWTRAGAEGSCGQQQAWCDSTAELLELFQQDD